MPQEYGDERLIFKLSSEDAVELDRLGDGFAALAREFNRLLGDAGIGPADARAKLFVTNIRYSSVEFELATLSGLYLLAHATAEGFVLWTEFYNRIRDGLEFLAGRAARPKGFDHIEARNLDSFLNTVAGKRGAKIGVRRARYHHKSRRRETIAEFEFTEQDVANAQMTLAREISPPPAPQLLEAPKRSSTEYNAPFIWFRTDREKGKASGQTSDRGIVAKITDRPLPVFFASEIDNHKDQMIKTEHNPFDLVYLVDVSVGYGEDGEPKAYTILNIHKTITHQQEGPPTNPLA